MMKSSKGFSIVELVVVVAIIAVLTAIVIVSVTTYINQGKNAAIKANLSTVQVNGTVYFNSNGNYNNFCTNGYYTAPQAAIIAAGGSGASCVVNINNTAWCACSTLKITLTEPTGSTFCVDSTGYKRVTQSPCGTRCQASTAFCT